MLNRAPPVRIIDPPMKSLRCSSLVALIAAAVFTGCHSRPLATTDHARTFVGVANKDVTFFSPALNQNMQYRVYLPEIILPGARLPTVYLLHGCGTSFRDWSNYSDVGTYATSGLVLVMVDGECSYYMNEALSP